MEITSRQMNFSGDGHQGRGLMSVFNGGLYLALPQDGKTLKGADRIHFNPSAIVLLRQELQKLKAMGPSSSIRVEISRWDREERKLKLESIIIVGKDEKNCYYFEFNVGKGAMRYRLSGAFGLSRASETPSDEDISALSIDTFIDYLENYVPFESVLTKQPPMARPGGGGGNDRGQGRRDSAPSDDHDGAPASGGGFKF